MSTKEKILDVAEDLMRQSGVTATSFQKISQEVGIRKASIYHHFANKDALICAMIERCRDIYCQQYKEIVRSKISAIGKIKAILQVYEDGLVGKRMCIVGMLSAEEASLGQETRVQLQTSIRYTIDIYTDIFRQGQQEQSLSCSAPPLEMATMFFFIFYRVLNSLQNL